MFTRESETYDVDPGAASRVLGDPTNPLHHIADAIPDGSRVLDVGAGNGLLARVLEAAGKEITIDGLEPSAYAGELARPHYRRFFEGYFQDHIEEVRGDGYDYLVLADVIEHVPDPLALLRLTAAVSPHTRILLSTPNVAFGGVRLALLDGRWDYVDSGILERTHLRYFTRAVLLAAFEQAGLRVDRELHLQKSLLGSEIKVRRSLLAGVGALALRRDELALTYQFLYVLRPGRTLDEPTPQRVGQRTRLAEVLAWLLSPRPATRASFDA